MKSLKLSPHEFLGFVIIFAVVFLFLPSCGKKEESKAQNSQSTQIGVLLVNHGSRSDRWREMLQEVENQVKTEISTLPNVSGIKTAFMEYTEPSIATQLKAFDDEGVTDIIVVPLLLRVSSHSFDDIPTIMGLKEDAMSKASLKSEGIKRFTPRASVSITPLLDYSNLLRENVVRRVKNMSSEASEEGVVLVAYGSKAYDKEWQVLLKNLSADITAQTGIQKCTHAWCGHLVEYSSLPTMDAISEIMKTQKRAIVVPLLVAEDEFFQGEIIGSAVFNSGFGSKVIYRGDAVLPDSNLNQWVIDVVTEMVGNIVAGDS